MKHQVLLFGQRAVIDLRFTDGATPGELTISGGANGTVFNRAGTLVSASAPRFDYSPTAVGQALGLLIEEERTNFALRSAEFDNAAWNADAGATCSAANAAVSPDGQTTADELDIASGTYRSQATTGTATIGQPSTASAWMKSAASGSAASMRLSTNNGAAWSTGGSTKTTLSLSWQRVSVTWTQGGTANVSLGVGSRAVDGSTDATCVGRVLAWGGQLEAGAFATSYIPTQAAAVTRTADNITGSFSADALTFVVEFDLNAVTGTRPILSLDDATADNQIRLYASGTDLKLTVTAGGVTQADLTLGTVAANTTYKAAFSCRANEFRAVMSGGAEQSDAAGTMPVVTTLRIGSDMAGNYQNGHNARTRGWTRRLSNLLSLV